MISKSGLPAVCRRCSLADGQIRRNLAEVPRKLANVISCACRLRPEVGQVGTKSVGIVPHVANMAEIRRFGMKKTTDTQKLSSRSQQPPPPIDAAHVNQRLKLVCIPRVGSASCDDPLPSIGSTKLVTHLTRSRNIR